MRDKGILPHMVDLHTHSSESDGELTPSELIDHAVAIGLKAIALTDHDTVSGIGQAATRAKQKGIRFIPGVEFDVDFEPGEFHLLGLGLSLDKLNLMDSFCMNIRRHRAERNRKMIRIMQDAGLDISMDRLASIAGGDVIGRPHFAQWLLGAGLVNDLSLAFEKWLGTDCPFHVKKILPTPKETIEAVHKSGGKAVLAHPQTLRISWRRFEQYLIEWKSLGLDGIEVFHSEASRDSVRLLTELTLKHKLIATGGSDFHGVHRPDRVLGYGPFDMRLSKSLLAPFADE